MTFTFYIEGQPTDVRDLTVNRLKMGTLEILVPYETSVGVGNSFELKENSTTLLKGKIIRIRDQVIVGVEKKTLTCLDSTHTLYEKYCVEYGYHEYYNGNGGYDAGWIAKDLVDHYFSGILTSNNIDTTTGVNVVRIEFDGKTVGAALEELAKRANCYFYVDNDDDVHFFIAESVSSGKTIQGTDLSKLRVTDESIRHIKKVIVRGRHRAIQASAGSGYPEAFYQDNRIISLEEAQEVANALKAELDRDRQQIELTLPEFFDVRPGETLVLNAPDRGFNNETLPIQKVRWIFSPTREKTVLTVGDEQPTLDSVLADLARGINWEPSVQIPSGTTFPADPVEGMLFRLTEDIESYCKGLYRWDGSEWDLVAIAEGFDIESGTEFPTSPAVGDYFYRTDLNTLFRCDSIDPDVWMKVVYTTGEGTSFPAKATLGALFYRTDKGYLYRCTQDICTADEHWSVYMRVSLSGTYAERPASGDVVGEWYFATDTMELYRWNGSVWDKVLQKVRSVTDVSDLDGLVNVEKGDTCYVINAGQTFYYNGTKWVPLATISHQGTTAQRIAFEPNASIGDIWFDTDDKKFYRWNGLEWKLIGISEVQEDLGYVDIGLPIYDPTHYLDDRYEEGYNDWSEGTTFKEPGYALSIYRLTKIAVVAKFIADAPATGELQIKVEYSFDQGVNWYLFGTVISVTSDQWAEYTRTDDIVGDISQEMWVRFSYRVGQTGEGAVHGYIKDCELRTRYKKTRWEIV
ncbi:MAG: hypothetical protein ACTSPB_02530 [Candidatus Thorarchaeota archaeon]